MIQKEFSVVIREQGPFLYGSEVMVTVTNVRMSSDMGIAYIYLSVFNAPYKQEVIKILWDNLAKLRGELGKRIRKQVRRIPMIKFFIDDTLDEMDHIGRLFDEIHEKENSTRSMKDAMQDKEFSDEEE